MNDIVYQVTCKLENYRNIIDRAVIDYIGGYEGVPETLKDVMVYAASGGKRLRGSTILALCEAFGRPWQQALLFAVAIELIHAYSLVHDDMPCMDNDDYRRGKPTCHRQYGEATALLCGDALLTMAFEAATSSPQELGLERILKASRMLARAAGACGMVGGQMMDLALEGVRSDPETVSQMYRMKTGALFEASGAVGALLGGAADDHVNAAGQWGLWFGLGFQILDDIEDSVNGGSEVTKDTLVKETSLREACDAACRAFDRSIEAASSLGEPGWFIRGLSLAYARKLAGLAPEARVEPKTQGC